MTYGTQNTYLSFLLRRQRSSIQELVEGVVVRMTTFPVIVPVLILLNVTTWQHFSVADFAENMKFNTTQWKLLIMSKTSPLPIRKFSSGYFILILSLSLLCPPLSAPFPSPMPCLTLFLPHLLFLKSYFSPWSSLFPFFSVLSPWNSHRFIMKFCLAMAFVYFIIV